MKNRFRLSSNFYNREKESEKIDPHKVFFLSVEGNITEKEYFDGISAYREELGIDVNIDVEVLNRSRKDNRSAPEQVIELLEEFIRLRETGDEGLLDDIPKEFIKEYGIDFIRKYLENPEQIPAKRKNDFLTKLREIGYDINYRYYLKKYSKEKDKFAILIDRDQQSHSEVNMLECIRYCKEKGYDCYISNPCFEFWLLLHLADVKVEFEELLDEIYLNRKVSNEHTFVSKLVSQKAHHGKSGIGFKNNYLPFVDEAIRRAKEFASDENALIGELGCNVWKLLAEMKKL